MQIRFPRKIRLGFRPVYGLTIRQLIYLAAFGLAGGLVILAGSVQGVSLIVRALVGLGLIIAGLTLTFLRLGGLALDEWIPIAVRYLLHPRFRVWRKRNAERPSVSSPKPPAAPARPAPPAAKPRPQRKSAQEPLPTEPNRRAPAFAAAIVLTDAFLLLALAALTIYLREGGLYEVQLAFAKHFVR